MAIIAKDFIFRDLDSLLRHRAVKFILFITIGVVKDFAVNGRLFTMIIHSAQFEYARQLL